MVQSDDQIYFSNRYAEEIECGDQAASAMTAAIHYELAYRYSLIVRGNMVKPALTLVVGGKNAAFTDLIETALPDRETVAN